MPKFLYTAKDIASGGSSGGEATAEDEKALAADLRSRGLLLTSIRSEEERSAGISIRFLDRFKSVPLKEKMTFTRNLSVMISSGLTISRAIQNLGIQTTNTTFRGILAEIHDSVQGGGTLADALSKFPTVFNELYVNMISVGEISGNLEQVLDILAVQLEKENDLSSKVKGALIYPVVVLVAMVGITVLMLTYILPKMMSVFNDMHVDLPTTTKVIIAASNLLRDHYILVIVFTLFVIIGGRLFSETAFGRRILDWLYLRLPIVGNIVVKVNCARFSRIYSALLKSGVAVVKSLEIVSKTLSNVYYHDVIEEAIAEIQKGTDLSKVIEKYPKMFPVLVAQIISVGEETGKTEMVLEQLAGFYEDEVTQITKNMSSILEPLLMLMIGGGVGFFAVAMMQPMYSIMNSIK